MSAPNATRVVSTSWNAAPIANALPGERVN
jgi:hypothetical protein